MRKFVNLELSPALETLLAKNNEIPAAQELLKKTNIKVCLIVADALNCQQKTAETIVKGKGDYLLDAKGNQPNLEREISEYVKTRCFGKVWIVKEKQRKTVAGLKPGPPIPHAMLHGYMGKKSGKT